jgi:hypothetical protein
MSCDDARGPGRPASPAGPGRNEGREANLSTERSETGEEPRLPAPHVHAGRPCHHPVPPFAGPAAPVRVKRHSGVVWRIRDRATFEACGGPIAGPGGAL